MKQFLIVAFVVGMIIFYPWGHCGCVPASENEATRWGGNEDIVVKEEKVYRQLNGAVTFQDEEPASGALVEVYTHPEYLLMSYAEREKEKKKQRRVAACITGEDGKFCFGSIEGGKYELRVSQGSGMNVTHIYVEVDPYSGVSTEDELTAVLKPGT
jgi:protocatechuate 3,4-dioxygenase beta subunit